MGAHADWRAFGSHSAAGLAHADWRWDERRGRSRDRPRFALVGGRPGGHFPAVEAFNVRLPLQILRMTQSPLSGVEHAQRLWAAQAGLSVDERGFCVFRLMSITRFG